MRHQLSRMKQLTFGEEKNFSYKLSLQVQYEHVFFFFFCSMAKMKIDRVASLPGRPHGCEVGFLLPMIGREWVDNN